MRKELHAMSTPQEQDSLEQDAQIPDNLAQPNTIQGQSQDQTQQQIDQLRRASDQDEVSQQSLDALDGTPAGQVPGIVSGNDDQDADLIADDATTSAALEDADLDDADDTDDMTAADMAGEGG
jgi:hypothetical protein